MHRRRDPPRRRADDARRLRPARIFAYLNLPEGAQATATIESKTNFFRPVSSGHVEAVSRVLHKGRTTIVVETDLRDADGKHVARVTQTQAVI